MKVILTENVETLGKIGDVVNVSTGYARNYLIPKKLAMFATEGNVKVHEHKKRMVQAKIRKQRQEAENLARQVENLSITIPAKVGEEDRLFGSVTSAMIQEALKREGIEIDKKRILLDEPIKSLGVFNVPVKIFPEVTAKVKIWVVKE